MKILYIIYDLIKNEFYTNNIRFISYIKNIFKKDNSYIYIYIFFFVVI